MGNVWKVASRWSDTGHKDSSILDIFRSHNVVFVGRAQERFRRIEPQDLIVISDGKVVVAMGLAMAKPKPVTELPIDFSEAEMARFWFDKSVWACQVSFTDLPKDDWRSYRIGTFHSVNERADEFWTIFKKLQARYAERNEFEILARSCTLLKNDQCESDILWKQNVLFQVPIYQRPYSWGEQQVRKLVTELLDSFHGANGKAPKEPMFIGTMQLSDAKALDHTHAISYHEVIDGQQRLSTLILIFKVLKDRFPEQKLLRDMALESILQTRVSNGVQQSYLEEALLTDTTKQTAADTQNPYLRMLPCIIEILDEPPDEKSETEKVKPLDGDELTSLVDYLTRRVYFVVIETRATLSKMLQIFDAINTAGMDLNGGDIFKVRYYEYLRAAHHVREEVFEEIGALYEAVDKGNKTAGRHICSMQDILALMQHILIARHALPTGLHDLAASTFFERFFDTVLRINSWPNFTLASCERVRIDIAELAELVKQRFLWTERFSLLSAEARCAMGFVWWSRYGRYDYLPILFRYRFGLDSEPNDMDERFIIALSKLLRVYSVVWRKTVYSGHGLMYELLKRLFAKETVNNQASVLRFIAECAAEKREALRASLEKCILSDNAKAKNLVCRSSALLDELGTDRTPDPHELYRLLFESPIDIEHIEPSTNKDGSKRIQIEAEWGNELNQIGNLMVLEMSLNRSIQNEDYRSTKLPTYKTSKFSTVRRQAHDYQDWDLAHCRIRKRCEIERLLVHLCGT